MYGELLIRTSPRAYRLRGHAVPTLRTRALEAIPSNGEVHASVMLTQAAGESLESATYSGYRANRRGA